MNAIVKDLEQALRETTLGEWLPTKAGDCELCGRWDTALIQGIGACCRTRRRGPARQARCALPCNEHMFGVLTRLQAAVLMLDEQLAIVARIEIGDGEPTIHLQQAPRPGVVTGVCELVRMVDGQRQTFCRASFMGLTVEWLTL